jgi:hypothetical protein
MISQQQTITKKE